MPRLFLIGGLAVFALGLGLWWLAQPPEGVETMSPQDTTIAWIGLASSCVGLLSALVSLIATLRR